MAVRQRQHVRTMRPVQTSVGACPECGKWRYLSKSAAKADARRRQVKRGGPLYRPYKCGDYWHLTSDDRANAAHYRRGD